MKFKTNLEGINWAISYANHIIPRINTPDKDDPDFKQYMAILKRNDIILRDPSDGQAWPREIKNLHQSIIRLKDRADKISLILS